jgi:hypothetical protein
MLVVEWHSWWKDIPALEAREALALHHVLSLSDAGWKFDNRATEYQKWSTLAADADPWRVSEQSAAATASNDISGEIRGLFQWMSQRWWGDSGQTMGFGESAA